MKLAVLAHNLIDAGGLSVGRNIISLLPHTRPDHTYLMFVPAGLGYDRHDDLGNVTTLEVVRMNPVRRCWYEAYDLPKTVNKFRPDFILGLGNIGLVKPPCTQAILVHQPHLFYDAKHFGNMALLERLRITKFLKSRMRKTLKHTNLIFCQTPVARDKFSETFNYPIDKIKIAPNAVSQFSKIDQSKIDVPEIYKNEDYFNLFYLTRFCAHKNLEILIDVFRQYREILNKVRCIVTVSPEQHPNAPKFLADIKKYNLQKSILNVGPLKQSELAGYFCNSDALLFPTLLESFTGTYLEAMHFGTPILTSDLDFARYVCEDAAIYFDPWNPADIKDKILTLKNNPQQKHLLVKKGYMRLKSLFRDWPNVVEGMLKTIEEL